MRALATRFGYMVTQGGKPLGIGSRLPDFEHSPLHPRRYPRATGCLGCLTLNLSGRQEALGGTAERFGGPVHSRGLFGGLLTLKT